MEGRSDFRLQTVVTSSSAQEHELKVGVTKRGDNAPKGN